ncbi:hypothetical protein EO244_05575 [Ancylomarina salipaludis]|uniref:Uncharacterized protein n=1 Tax=Ancylomarina salipaludis TaxID=2501299 RepID=A0A4Q1JMH6_9BACT|nr:hypothetical protein [Ancylomarina salipaludis]RXQ95778.1 hypothetical protein EO244_05575 [Ancylomarina salipaludis]
MKKFSIRLILIIVLIVGGPVIQKMLMVIQQKEHISIPISDTDQTSLDEDTEECESWAASPVLKPIRYFSSKISVTFQTSALFFSRLNIIVLPPPKFRA